MAKRPAYPWTTDIEEEILDAFAEGALLTNLLAPKVPGMPTLKQWAAHERDYPEFRKKVEISQELWARVKWEECLRYSDNTEDDWHPRLRRNGETIMDVNGEAIQRSRLKVETRMRIVERMFPEKYGSKSKVEVTGKDGQPLNGPQVNERELARRVAFMLQRGDRSAAAVAPAVPASGAAAVDIGDEPITGRPN